jgi:hypothetical protein
MTTAPQSRREWNKTEGAKIILAAALVLSAASRAQTLKETGSLIVKGTVKVAPQSSQNVRIFAVFPPTNMSDQMNHFALYVMTQGSIDGVTDNIIWANIETTPPSATPCASPGTDVCQIDLFGWYHIYSWASTDTTLGYWFSSSNGWGTKAVNIIGVSQNAPAAANNNANAATPYYITTPSWIAHTGGTQNYINSPQDSCTNWTGPTVVSITDAGGVATVTLGSGQVSMANGYPPTASLTLNDIVWIQGTGTGLDTTAAGTPITSTTTGMTGTNQFTYNTGCTGTCSVGAVGTAITSVQSWLVPYQIPEKTGLKAFIAAAIQHFGPNHSGITVQPSQVDYMRFGKSVGGESFVYCTSHLPDFPAGTPYAPATWQNYITEMTDFQQSQSPTMLMIEPINLVGTDNADYPNYEAKDAIAHASVYGGRSGFGSQGLSAYDSFTSPTCASNWCILFGDYFAQGGPLELQQIANSDPYDETCGTLGSNCGPGLESGDLRVWLPFAVGKQMNILELYSLDAELAFDPVFCYLNSPPTACMSGSYTSLNALTTTQQFQYFQGTIASPGVGLGYPCYTGTGYQSSATGGCNYSTTINLQHGYH